LKPESAARPYSPFVKTYVLPVFRLICHGLFATLGPIKARGGYRVPKTGGVIILANHLADVDPIVVQSACPRPIHYMAKSELFDLPVIGSLMRLFEAFPVKRGEPDRAALKMAADLAKSGEVVGIFPEGQLSETGELQPLLGGAALIVRMAGVPVICCGIVNSNRVLPYGQVIPRPSFTRVHATWGEPRTFDRSSSAEEILAWAEGQLRSLTDQEPVNVIAETY